MSAESEPSWKVADIAGSEVETEKGERIGRLKDVLPTGANDVFVVERGRQEILVPALKSVVLSISAEEKKIVVRMPEGLEEIYAPKNPKERLA